MRSLVNKSLGSDAQNKRKIVDGARSKKLQARLRSNKVYLGSSFSLSDASSSSIEKPGRTPTPPHPAGSRSDTSRTSREFGNGQPDASASP